MSAIEQMVKFIETTGGDCLPALSQPASAYRSEHNWGPASNNALYSSNWGTGKSEAPDGRNYLKVGQTKEALVCPSTWRKPASLRDGLKIKKNECVFAG